MFRMLGVPTAQAWLEEVSSASAGFVVRDPKLVWEQRSQCLRTFSEAVLKARTSRGGQEVIFGMIKSHRSFSPKV